MNRYIKICNQHRKANGLKINPGRIDCPNKCPAEKTCALKEEGGDHEEQFIGEV